MKISTSYILFILSILCLVHASTKAQSNHFTMSSVGFMGNIATNSETIQFNRTKNCLFVENGLSLANLQKTGNKFVMGCPTGLQFNTLGLKFYPNPVYTNAHLRLQNKPPINSLFTLSIWTIDGHIVNSSKIASNELVYGTILQLSYLEAGSYILKLETNQFVDAIKFVKLN
ncbi:MAG: hypothetical protein RLZ56_67 [Bacteroidota bacterium]